VGEAGSRKKVWGWTDHKSPRSKIAKRFANKKARNTKGIQNGGAYKQVFCSWDICDSKFPQNIDTIRFDTDL